MTGVAARSEAWNVFARLNTGIVGSNPARGMDICMRLFCLCCPVKVAALRRADHSSKESYQLSISIRLRNLIRRGQGPIWARGPLKKKKNLQSTRQINLAYKTIDMHFEDLLLNPGEDCIQMFQVFVLSS
jgi:hypothetical protein